MGHCIVNKAEDFLDKEIKVLDKGFIRLVDYMGSDERIVSSARVSYGKGTKSLREDKNLIDYLWRNEHTSPFEQVVFTFHCKMPIFVARQWIRHRTARVNEISGRYSIMKSEFYTPKAKDIKFQSKDNKQGRSEKEVSTDIENLVKDYLNNCYAKQDQTYNTLIEKDIAREIARICLPLSLYTEWYWQIDLKNLLHFLKLRLDEHAQFEIREYAKVIADLVKVTCPYTWEAFENHTLNSVKLSKVELNTLKTIIENNSDIDKSSRTYRLLKEKLDFI